MNISKIRIGSSEYDIYDTDAHEKIEYIANKEYNREKHSGKGRKTLELKNNSNILTQGDFDLENVIYIISYDFSLNGQTINIPDGCILDFEGGSLDNGSLSGTTEILHKPTDLYEKVNCMELYVLNETHLSVGDVSDLLDRYNPDEVVSLDAIANRASLSHFYCIAGMDKLIFRMPSYALNNDLGTTYPNLPYIRYVFYDRDFKFIDVRPEWTERTGMYIFTDIPENAVYVNVFLSTDDHWNKPIMLLDALKYIYFNFLDNTKVYIDAELKDNADVIRFDEYSRKAPGSIFYYSYDDQAQLDKYLIYVRTIGNLSAGSYFIPRSILKNYDFIELVGHGPGARYTFVDDNGVEEERPYNPMIISFLKKTPIYNGEPVEHCDTYPWRLDFSNAQRVTLAIPDDCKCIFINTCYTWNDSIWDCSPAQILLKKKSACDIGGFDTNDLSKISNRNVNTREIKFIHWNIGADNIGGMIPDQSYVTNELLTKRRNSFEAFFNKINRTHNLLLNEFNYWFDSEHRVAYDNLTASSVWYGRKRFDMRHYQDLGIFYKDNLLEYVYGTFECLKGKVKNGRESIYSYGYVIYHYPIAGANLYVMHTHLPTPLDNSTLRLLYQEMKSIMSAYPNSVILGDFNDAGTLNTYTHTGNNFANLEAVFTNESGWHIANKELDNTPTYDFGKDFWNPTQPTASRVSSILDFCLWKGAYITMSDFRVRRDAIITGSEALEATEGVFINANGGVEGNEAYINHRLSDHWPIECTIRLNSTYNITPDTEGSIRYDEGSKNLQWHDGEEWLSIYSNDKCRLLNPEDPANAAYLDSGDSTKIDLNKLIDEGDYYSESYANTAKLSNKPAGLQNAFRIKVRNFVPDSTKNKMQIIFPNVPWNCLYYRHSYWESDGYAWSSDWKKILLTPNVPTSGTTAQRPTVTDIGFVYFDTTINKPVYWNGSTWVDSTGNSI